MVVRLDFYGLLLLLLIAQRVEVRHKILRFCQLENIGEGRHLFSTVENLSANLRFVQAAPYSGEIGSFLAAVTTNGMALLTAAILEYVSAANARVV